MKLQFLSCAVAVLFFASSEARRPRLYNGKDAEEGQFPFMALLTYGGVEWAWKMCGAAIIHPRWAVTAAHCVIEYEEGPLLTVGTIGDYGTGEIYEIEQFYVHENYTYIPEEVNDGLEIVYNDIGLIYLKSDIKFNDKVKAVKLETNVAKSYENVTATAMGWGREEYWGEASNHLRYAEVPVLTMDECKKVWTYAKDHVCTSNKDKGVCNGDSGSPLVVDGVQIGVTSTTDTYCESLKPDMYTKVASFVPWIESKLNEHKDSLELSGQKDLQESSEHKDSRKLSEHKDSQELREQTNSLEKSELSETKDCSE